MERMGWCLLFLSWLFAPNAVEHKEMFIFSSCLLCIDWGFQIILSGILTAQLFQRWNDFLFFWFSFHLDLFFLWDCGGRAVTLRWNWASFCSINGLHCCSCNSPGRGTKEAFPAHPAIGRPPLLSSFLERWKLYSSGSSSQGWTQPICSVLGITLLQSLRGYSSFIFYKALRGADATLGDLLNRIDLIV